MRKLAPLRQALITLLTTEQLTPRERAEAGRALSVLGDTRNSDELLTIPAGKFWMGSDKTADQFADDRELPQHEVNVAEFQIGKYPSGGSAGGAPLLKRRALTATPMP